MGQDNVFCKVSSSWPPLSQSDRQVLRKAPGFLATARCAICQMKTWTRQEKAEKLKDFQTGNILTQEIDEWETDNCIP